uniref:Peptidase A2 domain-containing protein n=1 Tax=Glossina palpalis gambiensis TaxID=67801 RepID=A0A1B0AL35_9MUSC
MTGSTLVASLTIGGLATTGVVDTGATRSIIREDFIGLIPHIVNSETRSHTIRMVAGASQDSKRSITVEAKIGDMSFNLELLVAAKNMPTLPSELLFATQNQDYAFGLDASGLEVEPLSTGAEHYEEIVPPPPPIDQTNRSVHESQVENQNNPEDNDRNRKMHKKPAITEQKIIEVKKLASCEVERESGPTNTKKATIDVRAARTMTSTTRNKAANAATTRPDIPEPKYGTHERVVNATVRSARALEELHSVTTRGDTTIAITASRKTNKNKKDLGPKAGKVNNMSSNTSKNNRGPCVHHCPQQGQFNELASPSPHSFYGSSADMEGTSDAAKPAYIWHNQADKWLPLYEGDPIPNRGSSSIGR